MIGFYAHANAYGMRDLAIERRACPGGFMFAVWVNGAILRSKPYQRERWFATEEAAIKAGKRARR